MLPCMVAATSAGKLSTPWLCMVSISMARAALQADGDLLDSTERAVIEALLAALQASRESTDHHAIDAAVEALAQGTEGFAAERMNRSIRVAFAGKSVDQI